MKADIKYVIFPEHKIAYCQTPKTGITSITYVLQHFRTDYIESSLKSSYDVHHPKMKEFQDFSGDIKDLEGYFIFAFARNPWDRAVSAWRNKCIDGRYIRPELAKFDFTLGMTFDEFVKNLIKQPRYPIEPHVMEQHYFFMPNGRLLPNYIGRFENLVEDFNYVRKIIEMKTKIILPRLPHLMKSTKKNYREYYTPELIELVRERYQKDIDILGYKF